MTCTLGGLTRWLVLVAIGLALADEVEAQSSAQAGRSGGLLPVRQAPSGAGSMSREEILHRFDLDADGRIDAGEAENARMRMRRERIETLQNSGIDPLTGRPRDAAAAIGRVPVAEDGLLLVPGNPDDRPRPTPPRTDAAKTPAAKPPANSPTGRLPALTGGVRAGAPAVRPGYGAPTSRPGSNAPEPKRDLNAGRPRAPQPPLNAPRAGTGLQPSGPQPGSSGPPRTSAPRPPLTPRNSTRPTAEDIGR